MKKFRFILEKKVKNILLLLALVGTTACNDLNVPPPNRLTDSDVFNSEAGVRAYMTRLYSELPIEDFKYNYTSGFNRFESFWGLGPNSGEWIQANTMRHWSINGDGFGYWPYSDIRNTNYFLLNLKNYSSSFQEKQINAWLGEAYFCRAYYYFGMVKRYGGVPIIKGIQQYPQQPLEELQVPRDKEEAVYDFISEDLDLAIQYLPETSESGRANKYAAAALKSRAMLYAASIARYGKGYFTDTQAYQKGFVGIPESRATDYYTQAYEAAKLLDGKYSLYQQNTDLVQNYVDLFLDKNSHENVFVKDYLYLESDQNSRHSWDAFSSPRSSSSNYAGAICPTVNTLELFGELKTKDEHGNYIIYNSRAEFLETLTPRQRAIALFPGEVFRNKVVDVQAGLFKTYTGVETPIRTNDVNALYNVNGTDYNIIGYDGIGTAADPSSPTGLYMRKYNNYKKSIAEANLWRSDQNWIDIRYAEVLLNMAEAALELGGNDKFAEALNAVNQIRTRGGDKAWNSTELTIKSLREERCRELAFENQKWWDIRRWRIAEQIREQRYKSIYPYYIIDTKKWIFMVDVEPHRCAYSFDLKYYYEPIPRGEIDKSPNLLPNNPLY